MSGFVYVVTEGVHDVAFLGKLLGVCHGAQRVKKRDALDDPRQSWLRAVTNWPIDDDITRMGVPAPAFFRTTSDALVALRNAQGITRIGEILDVDLEHFRREAIVPDTIGVVLDSDDKPAAERFNELADALGALELTPPAGYGDFSTGTPRVGAFALPDPGTPGTLEDLLLVLGDAAYPELTAAARAYVDAWLARELSGPDWKELRKPAGPKKATIAAITALLKPGKSTQVSLDDNRWVGQEAKALPGLAACLNFIETLLTPASSADSSRATP